MKTRISKWEKYRKEIYTNIKLHTEIINFNKQLSTLYSRLLKVFPEYSKYFKQKIENKIKFNTPNIAKKIQTKEIENIINNISILDNQEDFEYLNDYKFYTGELNTIIKDLQSRSITEKSVKNNLITSTREKQKIVISKPKKVLIK